MDCEFVLPPLSRGERDQYYTERKRMAALFGIPAGALPSDWAAFGWYTAEMVESPLLGVGEDGRALGHSVLSGVGTRVRPPRWHRALTAFWMPPRLRTAFELSFGALEEEAVRRAARWLSLFYSRIPGLLRLVGPFHEADARLRGRSPARSRAKTTASGWASLVSSTRIFRSKCSFSVSSALYIAGA